MWNAFKGVLYKEWIKVRYFYAVLFVCSLFFMLWIDVKIYSLFRLDHGEIVWYRMIGLGQVPYQALLVLPVLSGLCFALWQFLPEMRDERLRLSLHLPCGSVFMVCSHLLCGVLFLAVLFAVDILLFYGVVAAFFPYEYSVLALLTAAVWFTAGISAYLACSVVLIEPQRHMRVYYAVLFSGLFVPLYSYRQVGELVPMLPFYCLAAAVLFFCAVLPIYHYRLRRV